MVRELRKGKSRNGLVLANGGWLTHQYVICLSTQPRNSPYPSKNPLPDLLADKNIPDIEEQASGDATIEVRTSSLSNKPALNFQTYTVEFNRDGTPLRGHIVGRLKSNGHRFLANHGDARTLHQLSSRSQEQIGRSGCVVAEGKENNLFTLDRSEKL
jgi:hypothetical protein